MTLEFDHYVKKLGSKRARGINFNWYRFRVFVNEEDTILNNIEYVEYQLHPSFPRPNRRVGRERMDSGFYLEFEGYAGFLINIIVGFSDGHEEEYSYQLHLEKKWPEGLD